MTGVLAAWLLAVAPLHVFYSQEVRMYALLILCSLVFIDALLVRLSRHGAWGVAAVSGALLCHLHYTAIAFVAAGLGWMFVREAAVRKQTLRCAALIVAGLRPAARHLRRAVGEPSACSLD